MMDATIEIERTTYPVYITPHDDGKWMADVACTQIWAIRETRMAALAAVVYGMQREWAANQKFYRETEHNPR